MATLLVDNHDSFTYNLFHLLAELTGQEPVVVLNDDLDWRPALLRHFDSVVISPGPGRPERRNDFGICRHIIEAGQLPLLGVCLGHQGLCHVHGGQVGPAPEPYHGRLSPVLHEGRDILAGVPSPFPAVRYHSLTVTRLADELEPIAWTPDQVLMAVRHRRLPAWGVQFHPESICTEHGRQILANFVRLAHEARAAHRPGRRVAPALPDRRAAAGAGRRSRSRSRSRSGVRPLRVLVRKLASGPPPEVAFEAFYGESEHAFWLDSSLTGAGTGSFSFMGDASGPLARRVEADVWTGRVTVVEAGRKTSVRGGFLDWLEGDLAQLDVDVPKLPFSFTLGWVGYLGYELKAECGGDRVHRSATPDAAMIFCDRAIAFDHRRGSIYLLALARRDEEGPAQAWLEEIAERLGELPDQPSPLPGAPAARIAGGLRLRDARRAYLRLIGACQAAIAQGETYEVCLTNMVSGQGEVDVWSAYRQLRRVSPSPFSALLRLGRLSLLSSSPERFIRVSDDGQVEAKPIKGTRPRSASAERDAQQRRALQTSEKDRAENLMIVDLVRNDLGRVAEVGSVRVAKLFDVESYATVHQLVSTVRAQLPASVSAVRCVTAAFPGGSMTGAPKVRTMQIIDHLESGPRGIYSGALGYFSLSGAVDLSMVIRTLVVTPGEVSFGVGGAIVALSDPDGEFAETAVKAKAILSVLQAAFPGRASPRRRPGRNGGTSEPPHARRSLITTTPDAR